MSSEQLVRSPSTRCLPDRVNSFLRKGVVFSKIRKQRQKITSRKPLFPAGRFLANAFSLQNAIFIRGIFDNANFFCLFLVLIQMNSEQLEAWLTELSQRPALKASSHTGSIRGSRHESEHRKFLRKEQEKTQLLINYIICNYEQTDLVHPLIGHLLAIYYKFGIILRR